MKNLRSGTVASSQSILFECTNCKALFLANENEVESHYIIKEDQYYISCPFCDTVVYAPKSDDKE